jgi:hypothetical protein
LREFSRAALPDALKRMPDSVRVISHLQAGLAPRAQLSTAHWVFGITRQFLGQPHFDCPELAVLHNLSFAFHHTHLDSAACIALRTNGWLPDSDTRYKIFFGDEPN